MKHRLMLSAATAALLAAPLTLAAHADTTITNNTKTALDSTTAGNITIQAGGGVEIKASSPAVTIDSNNFLTNEGGISNENTSSAIGVLVNTTSGNIVNSTGILNLGAISLTGDGAGKAGIIVEGGNTFFAPITLETITTTAGSAATTVTGSSVQVEGDESNAFTLVQGTTIDGDVVMAGSLGVTRSLNSTAAGDTAVDLEGNLQGNLLIAQGAAVTAIGNQARGFVILGPISPCQDNASLSYTCANSGTALASTGGFYNFGGISVVGVQVPNHRLQDDFESGSAVVIADSVAGGFLNAGPSTGNTTILTATISGNGDIAATSSGSVFSPVLLIDPSQSVTTTQPVVRGPALFGPVPVSVDSVDGSATGYAFINHGTISASPIDPDVSSQAVVIQGSSAINYTCFSGSATSCVGATPGTLTTVGGLLDTGTIQAQATTRENTTFNISSEALFIGAFTTVPRLDVSGEFISGTTFTAAQIGAVVGGPGGGIATAVQIGAQATVPQIDVMQHGSISATVQTSTISPDITIATAASPFTQSATAILDQSGSVRMINNAGSILAITTIQTAQSNAATVNISQAINLIGGTTGNTVINDSGVIEGDVLFNSGGGNNVLNVGNTGSGFTDASGDANATITTVQGGTAVTNTPFAYAIVSGHIDGNVSGAPPITEVGLLDFGSGTGNQLHVGGFGYVNDVIESAPGGVSVQVDNNGQLFVATDQAVPTFNVNTLTVNAGGELGLTITQLNTNAITPVVLAQGATNLDPNAKIGLQFGSFISSGTTAASVNNPLAQTVILVSAPAGTSFAPLIGNENPILAQEIPFLFEPTTAPLSSGTSNGNSTLLLTLTPRAPGATDPLNGVPGLGLSGDALALFPHTAAALANDPLLGQAIASSMTFYNTNGVPTSGINLAASQQRAQQVFSQFTPDVSGGTRQVAIMLTDQETGPTAARQRLLREYGNTPGDLTLWSTEFVGNINNKGRVDADGTLTDYKDHGFGFAVGLDAGSPRGGWYGGALSIYSGDVSETLPRASITHEFWYMLTGYTDWRGKHIFLDTTGSVGYGSLDGNRDLIVGNQARDAEGKRAALMGSLGATTGAFFNLGFMEITPHLGLDGLAMREEGYTENGGGDGLDLQVAPYYANSLRGSVGSDFSTNFDLWGATITPEARLGYRYDAVNMPVKLKAGFASTGGIGVPGNTITFVGPDPDTGNAVAGLSLGAGTDTWQLGVNYDWIRGNNGSTSQVGTLTLLGRI
ncbi:MAG TPA: autotransporter outer membrane beta-barrel domain-containing protein [Rhizomicrobium sp.]|nr:autotransporter outer membrane beta-barrel domain-containing protein [Rhizomicrobium sp.]